VAVTLGYRLKVIERYHDLRRQLGELVNEHGKHHLDEPLPRDTHPYENIGPEVLFRHDPAHSFYNVPPQPHRIVVLLV
jgi:hypothetical protein